MHDVVTRLVDVPLTRMFVLAGVIFLLVAVLGRIEGKIEPGKLGRIGASVVGAILLLVGLAMHALEGEALREWLRENAAQQPAAGRSKDTGSGEIRSHVVRQAAAAERIPAKSPELPASAAAKAGEEKYGIKVLAGTYGRNCGAKPGNATAHLARACDGRGSCDYRIDAAALEDPAPSCDKDYVAEWHCGAGPAVYAASVSGEAGRGGNLMLACSAR
jgi:hypothetical protein